MPWSETEAAEQLSKTEVICVNQSGSASQFCLKVRLVDAMVDSAAEISFISDSVFESMKQSPSK
ncbi:hypothetical protein DPMN_094252 [Dreissena polymorpha]|uniref:Uncharacterized protein n=1 Tax=Dreissena polymorpha TaxID=45954 RepID=A0A9D4L4G0_DREPO|nr:hypothetical protein DPMN_094252 [Dreissena polymorpha]